VVTLLLISVTSVAGPEGYRNWHLSLSLRSGGASSPQPFIADPDSSHVNNNKTLTIKKGKEKERKAKRNV
jgi:hypothetical protein